MRFYHRDREDLLISLNRCDFDARNGRVALALERIADLHDEFPDNSHVHYMEGLLRVQFLGQGQRAFALFVRASDLDPKHAFAACNAAVYAPTENAWRERVAIAARVAPKDRDVLAMQSEVLDNLSRGAPYHLILITGSQQAHRAQEYGRAAALLDLVLGSPSEEPAEEKEICRMRAACLRELDRVAARHHERFGEQFLPEERLALQDAHRLLERALELDPYDAELWNFRAAWLTFLGMLDEAIQAAEKALVLRPHGYAKPHHNKSLALWRLGRYEEARSSARAALLGAQEAQDPGDVSLAQGFLDWSSKRPEVTLEQLFPLFQDVLGQSRLYSEQEEARGNRKDPRENLEILAQGLIRRCRRIDGSPSIAYVPFIAELLSYVTPQTACFVLARVLEISREHNDHCLHATLYLAANATGVVQRDALRLMVLLFFGIQDSSAIRFSYRLAVLEPAAAVGEPYLSLDRALRAELSRFHPDLPRLIADQEPVDAAGVLHAGRVLLPRFEGRAPQMRGLVGRENSRWVALSVLVAVLILLIALVLLFR